MKEKNEKKEISDSIKFLRAVIGNDEKSTEGKEKSSKMNLQSYLGNWNDNRIIILTDNVQNVQKLIEREAFDGNMIINVDVKKPVDLALDIIRFKIGQDGDLYTISLINNNFGANLIENILRKKGSWTFCPEESICRTTLIEILDNINLLRLNEPNKNFEKRKDSNDYMAKKIIELDRLCKEYEKELKERKLYDEASAYNEAINIVKSNAIDLNNIVSSDTKIKIMFFEDSMSTLQNTFIKDLFKDDRVEKIDVNEISKGYNCNFTLKKCYGTFTEVYETLKDIQDNKIKFGDVALLYTNDVYVKYLKMLFAENDINVNILSSYSALSNEYLKLIIDILKFAKNDFLYKDLKKVVFNKLIKDRIDYDENKQNDEDNEGDIEVENYKDNIEETNDDGESNNEVEKNREKYKKYQNEQLKIAYMANIERLAFYLEHYKNFVKEKKDEFNYFTLFLEDLINVFDKENASKNFSVVQLYMKLLAFVDKWTTNRSKEKNMIKSKLKELAKNIELHGEVKEFSKAVDILIDELSIIRYSDEEKDNEIMATKFAGFRIINRKHIYILGLAAKYNASGTESPIMLDEERKQYYDYDSNEKPIGHNVQLKSLTPIKSSEDLLKTVESFRDANVQISTPYYDILDNMDLSESPLYVNILQEYANGIEQKIEKYPNIIDSGYTFDNNRLFQDNSNKNNNTK